MAKMVFGAQENAQHIDFFDTLRDTLSHYQHEVGYRGKRTKKGEFDDSVSLKEKEALLYKEFIGQVTKMAGINFDSKNVKVKTLALNPSVKWATYAIVSIGIDMILPDAIIGSDLSAFVDARFGALGDTFNFEKEANDLYLVYKNGNDRRHVEVQRDEKTNITIHPELYTITVQSNLYKVLMGTESIISFIMKAAYSIEAEVAKQVYDTMTASFEALSTTAGDGQLRVVGWSESDFITLAQKVEAWNNAEVVVAGTKLALQDVFPDTSSIVRVPIDSPYVTEGYIERYKGVTVMPLRQTADRTSQWGLNLKDNQLYIFSPSTDKIVKLAFAGDSLTIVDNVYANADLSQKASIHKRWGMAIATNSIGASIELN